MNLARRVVTRLSFMGRRHYCPCCDGRARQFLDSPDGRRRGVRCPWCRSAPRHRALHLYLRKRTDLFDGRPKRILHLAPNPQIRRLLESAPGADYVSADLHRKWVKRQLDLTDMPEVHDASFDVIICCHVLEHITEDRRAMSELYRILRPGAWSILLVPLDDNRDRTFEDPTITDPDERARLFGHPNHVRVYGRDYPDRLREAGFDVSVDSFVRELDSATLERLRLTRLDIHVCRRPGAE